MVQLKLFHLSVWFLYVYVCVFNCLKFEKQKKMKLNLSLILILSLFKMKIYAQNIETIINEKVHLTEEDMDQSNLSNDEESERKTHSTFSYQNEQQAGELSEIQSPSEMQTKKIHHSNYPVRTVFGSSNSISKTNPTHHHHSILTKPRPTVTHSHNTFSELDNQQILQQQTQFDNNDMDYQQQTQIITSTIVPFSQQDSQIRDNNWPFSSSSNLVTAGKPIGSAGEFTVNSNTLNFTNQGLDNLKVFNITSTNHLLPPVTFANIIPNSANYNNQQDPLSPHQIIANPIQNLVLRSFENFRRLVKNCEPIESYLLTKMNFPKNRLLHTLDPLELAEPLYWSSRDNKTPLLGKLKFTLENVKITGLSTFKTENLSNQGRVMFFKHRIPQLDFIANYTVDYLLFDEISLLISKGNLKAIVPNAYLKGSFSVLPDIMNVWFKIANLNISSVIEDVDIKVHPEFSISDRFRIERSTINKLSLVIKNIMPNVVDYLKLTYSKAIEMKIV